MKKVSDTLSERAKALWHFFSTYEKVWFISIVVLAIVFAFIFPETDDPTYTVTLDGTAITSNGNALDFSGIDGDFVITSVSIGSDEYMISDFTDVREYTVTPSDVDTLILPLPREVMPGESLSFECCPDGDSGEITVAVVSSGGASFGFTVDLTYGGDGCTVSENPPKYLVSVGFVMFLYIADIVTNIACELLISKQSKWNFIVSFAVEVIEILICIVCVYRFATLAVTLMFWIPCDIVSFIVWHKHPDSIKDELTAVKTLTTLQDVFIILGIIIWTGVLGYLLTFVEVEGGIFANNVAVKNIACYLDACVSAVGIANGLFILFRYREQWLAWYISAILETVINVMAGQWVLLVLKAGYLTNTTYGYIEWTKYIKGHSPDAEIKSDN
ncbi:MAG: nicotinamide riboside transporter PnuC [Clostridia bacterium]|nr:nicotinamide riboside transporter PnuC [Clostridia bacterium]